VVNSLSGTLELGLILMSLESGLVTY